MLPSEYLSTFPLLNLITFCCNWCCCSSWFSSCQCKEFWECIPTPQIQMKQVSNPPLLQVLFEMFKTINLRKNPDWCIKKPLKFIQTICKKKGKFDTNFTQSAVFWAWFYRYFSSMPNLSFLFALIFDFIPVFKPYFFTSQKVSDKYAKSGINLKYALNNCVFYFLICIMILIYEVHRAKKKHKWIQYSLNFKLVKFNFK